MSNAGRPTKLSPEIQAAIVAAIEAGNYRETAAKSAGIHRNTLSNWEKWGEAGQEPYADFLCALEKAEAKAEMDMLAHIRSAQPAVTGVSGADVWQAKAWIMERRWPKRWAARVRTVVAEEVESLEKKLRSRPALAAEVADVLAREGDGSTGAAAH